MHGTARGGGVVRLDGRGMGEKRARSVAPASGGAVENPLF